MILNDLSELRVPTTERYQLEQVKEYLADINQRRVCVLYGLRRTGKTTIIEQSIKWLLEQDGVTEKDILYITAQNDGMSNMMDYYFKVRDTEAKYVFIDEVGYINDLLEQGNIMYDSWTRVMGKRVVISGTNLSSIYVACKHTLFDRVLKIPMHYLTFYEHCKFVLHTDNPVWTEFVDYLQIGGLFEKMDSIVYLQESVVNHLNDTLATQDMKSLYGFMAMQSYPDATWIGLLNNICLYSAGNVNSTIIKKLNRLQGDLNHLKIKREDIDARMFREIYEYFQMVRLGNHGMKQTEIKGLLEFLQDCGFIFIVPNRRERDSESNSNGMQWGDVQKVYLSAPFMRYSFTRKIAKGLEVAEITGPSELLGNLLESCAISEYHMAHPEHILYFWREAVGSKIEECDLLVCDTENIIKKYDGKAFEFKLGHDGSWSGGYALQQVHPEYEVGIPVKLEGEEVMNWIYELGSIAYDDGATHLF